jgi:hypothetical protein
MSDAGSTPAGRPEVTLVVDGEVVELTDFVARFVASTLAGMLRALKGVPAEPSEVTLRVRHRPDPPGVPG